MGVIHVVCTVCKTIHVMYLSNLLALWTDLRSTIHSTLWDVQHPAHIRIQDHEDPSLNRWTNTAFSRVVSHISIFARSISATSCLRRSCARSRIACLSSVPLGAKTALGVDRLDADGVAEATLTSARAFPFCDAVIQGGEGSSVGEEDNTRART